MIKDLLNIFKGKSRPTPPPDRHEANPVAGKAILGVGDTIAGEYKVLQKFEGGMGYVYLTQDPLEKFQFVLKTCKQALCARARESFLKEAYSWIQIGLHPNILQAYWVRELDGELYVAAQYIPKNDNGHNSLTDYIRGGALSDALLYSFAAQFCHGMTHAAKAGVAAHRDVKPDNMLIYEGSLKIIDFGLSKVRELITRPIVADESRDGIDYAVWQTQEGLVSGTPPYMAPEQFLGMQNADTRSDIYSFGIAIWEALEGYPPILGRSISEFAVHHRDSVVPELQHPLWPLISKCLAKDPRDRYQSFSDVLIDLHAIADGQRIQLPIEPRDVDPELEGLFAKAQSWMALGFPEKARVDVEKYTRLRSDANCGWTEKAKILLAQNDASGALEACERSLAIFEIDSQAWNNKGIALSRLKRHEESVDCFKRALEVEPKNTGAMLNLGRPLIEIGRIDEAISILNRALSIAPEKASIWNNLGSIYYSQGNKLDAERCYEEALVLNPNLDETRSNLRSLRAAEPAASSLLQQGHLKEAKSVLLRDIRELDRPDDWHNLGLLYLDEGNSDEALNCFQKVVSKSLGDDFAYSRIVQLLVARSDFEPAIGVCEKWQRFGSDKVSPICMKAQILDYAGKTAEAIAMLDTYIMRYRSNDQFGLVLSTIYERNGQVSAALHSAQQTLDVLLHHKESNPQNLAQVKETIKRLRGKLATYEPASIKSATDKVAGASKKFYGKAPHINALNQLASVYMDLKQYDQAILSYKEAISIIETKWGHEGPAFALAPTLNNLASLYHKMGEKTEAKALYVRAVKLIEDDDSYGPSDRNLPKFLNNLAAVEDDLGHTQEAQSLRKRALDIQQNASDSKS